VSVALADQAAAGLWPYLLEQIADETHAPGRAMEEVAPIEYGDDRSGFSSSQPADASSGPATDLHMMSALCRCSFWV
jgi:hypothetical protein